jgi:hypothetical protein
MSTIEACWRIFRIEINYQEPTVERLNFYLENEQPIVFDDPNYLDNVLNLLVYMWACPTLLRLGANAPLSLLYKEAIISILIISSQYTIM